MSDALTPELRAYVDAQVASGRFVDADEVVRTAVRRMADTDELYRLKLIRLREAIEEGERSGPPEPFDMDAFQAEMDAELDGKRGEAAE